jgi:hypothetical protein
VDTGRRLLIPALMLCLTGCAFSVRANRPLTNALDRAVAPKSTGAKVALAPIAIPVGFASLTTDAVAIHPVRVIPRAYNSTANLIWRRPRGSYIRETFLFVPKVVLTPFYFSGNWAARSLFAFR